LLVPSLLERFDSISFECSHIFGSSDSKDKRESKVHVHAHSTTNPSPANLPLSNNTMLNRTNTQGKTADKEKATSTIHAYVILYWDAFVFIFSTFLHF
jgi:hypothetical protein